jgi:thiol-disulfide isomerase/thioredoxin
MKILYILGLVFSFNILVAQTAPDFTVTDSDGIVHELYKDHLDKGQTVVLKLFFTTCPPCITLLPWTKEKYLAWGSGQYDVEFIELSTQAFDSNEDVANYKIQHDVPFPGVGYDGGGQEAGLIYKTGTFGPYYGTPTYVIIAPDGTVTMGFSYDDFDELIAATGATGMDNGIEDPTLFSLNIETKSNSSPTSVKYILKSANSDLPKYDILEITGGDLSFEYPSDDFPELNNPVIVVEVSGSVADESMSGVDLLKIRKHMLELDTLTEPYQLLAADVNSDNKISPVDLLNLTKAILELIDEFPNDTPSWKSIPSQIELNLEPGQTIDLNFQLVKIGNVNG